MVKFLLDAPAALIQGVAGEVYDVEGIHDRPRVGEFFSGCALESGESIHRDDLNALAPGVGLGGQPGFEYPLGSTRDHVQEPGGTVAVSYGSDVQDDGDVFVAVGSVALAWGYECLERVVLAGPASHGCGDDFRPVICPYHLGCSMSQDSQVTHVDHVSGSHMPLDAESQVLACELINDVTDLEHAPLPIRVELEINGPHLPGGTSPGQVM